MSSTNRGAERAVYDAYYTSDEDAERLISELPIDSETVLEPSVGGGAFARALRKLDCHVVGVDIDPDASGFSDCDMHICAAFLLCPAARERPYWVVGNPPYDKAEVHIWHALDVTGRHVAFLLRLAMLESQTREALWRGHPPRQVFVLRRRPRFGGKHVHTGTDSAAYGFFWWDSQYEGPPLLGWI